MANERDLGGPGEVVLVRDDDGSSLEQQTRGEIDIQIRTARAYPRSIKKFVDEVLSLATLDQTTAEKCIYALPRGKDEAGNRKTIEGPSARLAEIVASCWQHMRVEARTVGEDDHFVSSRGMAWDLQANLAIACETRRRITDKKGRRYNDDMIAVTANAAASIAIRNAILKVVPSAFWRPIYEKCRLVAVGDQKTLVARRTDMLAYFQKLGITPDRVFTLLEVAGVEDINLEHVAELVGLANAIRDGETKLEEAFPTAAKVVPMPTAKVVQEPGSRTVHAEVTVPAGAQTAELVIPLVAERPAAGDPLPPAPTVDPVPAARPAAVAFDPTRIYEVAAIERPDPMKSGHKITFDNGLVAHTYHVDTVVGALKHAQASLVGVRLEGVLTTFAPAPLRIEKVIPVVEREVGEEG